MVYDVNLTLTGGEPYGTTRLVAMYVYDKAFNSRLYGVRQAEALGSYSITDTDFISITSKAHNRWCCCWSGKIISFDPNIREPLWNSLDDAKVQVEYGLTYCDVLKISDNEIQWFTGLSDYDEGIKYIQDKYNIPLILLSLGREGSRAYYKDIKVEVPAFVNANTIETTGAGDTFGGCSLHYVLENGIDGFDEDKLTQMLTFANAAASIVTTRKGALKVMPNVAEVEAMINK